MIFLVEQLAKTEEIIILLTLHRRPCFLPASHLHLRERAFLDGETVYYARAANQEAACVSRDLQCADSREYCRQAGMAAKQFTQKEILPFTEWGRDIEVGILFKL